MVSVGGPGVLDPHWPLGKIAVAGTGGPAIALVVDECNLATGLVRQVIARGRAEVLPFDMPRGRRKLTRYLGADQARWDQRFLRYVLDDPVEKGTAWLRLRPDFLTAKDLSYTV